MPLRNSETGKVMSEREAYMYAFGERLHQLDMMNLPKDERTARASALCNLHHDFRVISEKFDRENRLLRAEGQRPREEATLRPEFVRAVHKVQDEVANQKQPPHERLAGRKEIEKFDRTLEAIQEHYARDVQREPPPQPQREAGRERERSR